MTDLGLIILINLIIFQMNFPIILSVATKRTNGLGSAFGLKIIKKLNQKIIFRAIFLVQGCKGARTPMYRAFAPFSETVRGDRRVTGMAQGSAAVSAASGSVRKRKEWLFY